MKSNFPELWRGKKKWIAKSKESGSNYIPVKGLIIPPVWYFLRLFDPHYPLFWITCLALVIGGIQQKKSGCYWFIVHSQREILKRIRVCLMEKSNFFYSCNGSYSWSGMTHLSGSLSIHKGQLWPIYPPMNFHEAFISWTRRFLQIGYGPKQRWIQI